MTYTVDPKTGLVITSVKTSGAKPSKADLAKLAAATRKGTRRTK
jgi:hypothetical protein